MRASLFEKMGSSRCKALAKTVKKWRNFVLVYGEVGRLQESLQLTERVLEARKRTLGEEHPDTFDLMLNLANRYSDMGRLKEALQLTEQVIEAHKRTLAEERPDTLGSMGTYEKVLQMQQICIGHLQNPRRSPVSRTLAIGKQDCTVHSPDFRKCLYNGSSLMGMFSNTRYISYIREDIQISSMQRYKEIFG